MVLVTPLSLKFPSLAAEWHPTKNGVLVPDNVGSGDKRSIWWLGGCGHEWKAAINSRVAGRGCHYCSGYKVLAGFNDLASTHSEISGKWHSFKNGELTAEQVSAGSHRKVWWLGTCGHEWEAAIVTVVNGSGCNICAGKQILVGFNDLATTHPGIAAEWHPSKNGELTAEQVSAGSTRKVWWLGKECGHEWEMGCTLRSNQHQGCPYCAGKKVLAGFNDLLTSQPELIKEWHTEENTQFNLHPTNVTSKSAKKAWWVCCNGHKWEAAIYSRTNGNGCPYCANRVVSYGGQRGTKTILDLKPSLAEEWNTAKNSSTKISEVQYGSKKLYWWVCNKNHEWEASPLARVKGNTECPYCANKKVLVGFNDLVTTNPRLAAQWHPTKNKQLTPLKVTRGNDTKVWWLGECGHEWEAKITDRAIRGCPYCSNHSVLIGFNDLATTHPELVKEWHPTRNEVTVKELVAGSKSKVWWLCGKGHEWEATLENRTRSHSGCPQCAAAIYVSKAEKEIACFCSNLGLETKTSVRNVIKGELDIYIPEKNIAVEFNGLYWHSEAAGKGKYYHFDKWLACKDEGIQLIQVWEDEYKRNPEQVKDMLAHKLGVTNQRKVFARKTEIVELSSEQTIGFLNENHIQGAVDGGIRVGLVGKGTMWLLWS